MKNTIAIIPARGGSKGIKKKNIIEIAGKPLLAWSIKQALDANNISSVWVSSDDEEILNIACRYGANIINRPEVISNDFASSESVWIHAIKHLKNKGMEFDSVVGMQATSPIRHSNDLDSAIKLFYDSKFDSLLSVVKQNDFFIWEDHSKPRAINYDIKNRKRRQSIKETYLENGSFYIFDSVGVIRENNRLFGNIGLFVMDKYKSFQIDEYEDLKICEAIIKEFL
jgi:N-acylneuraminate cytidylyltransferase